MPAPSTLLHRGAVAPPVDLYSAPFTLDEFLATKQLLVTTSGDSTGYVDRALQQLGLSRRVSVTARRAADTDLSDLARADRDPGLVWMRKVIENIVATQCAMCTNCVAPG